MQSVIKNGQVLADDWLLLAKEAQLADLPENTDCIVPLALWQVEREALKRRPGPLAIWLDADEEVEAIAADLPNFALIALNFPAFTDGRAYSSAALLRQRYGFKGEIRAIGDVLRDQLFAMRRCGFDVFAIRADKDPHDALKGLADFSESYQGAAEQPLPLFRRRALSGRG